MENELFILPENVTVGSVASLKDELAVLIQHDSCSELTINGCQVKEIDAAGIQLLLALQKQLNSERKVLVLTEPSEKLVWALNTSGANLVISR